jgi:hypothetical protein
MPEDTSVEGHRIVKIRKMTKEEVNSEGWEGASETTPVIELDNGVKLFPSADEEGNGPGALFGKKGSSSFYVVAPVKKKKLGEMS